MLWFLIGYGLGLWSARKGHNAEALARIEHHANYTRKDDS